MPQVNENTQDGQPVDSGERSEPDGLAEAKSYRIDLRRIDFDGQSSVGRPSLEMTHPKRKTGKILKMDDEKHTRTKLRKRNSIIPEMSAAELLRSVTGLVKRMEQAAFNDIKSHDRGEPAIEKLKMLDEVEEACIHRDKQPLLLNEGLLGVLKSWIEPLSDGTLPTIKIRTTVLRILQKLPIDTAYVTYRTNLKESQIGSRVMFLR